MVDPKKKYKVTWLNNSDTTFEIEMTKAEKIAVIKFLHEAAINIPSTDMPSITFEEKE